MKYRIIAVKEGGETSRLFDRLGIEYKYVACECCKNNFSSDNVIYYKCKGEHGSNIARKNALKEQGVAVFDDDYVPVVDKTPTKQGDYEVGNKKPPKSRQFGQPNGNPRNSGAWKKEDTARYKLEQMLKLSEEELKEIAKSKESPLFERKLAVCIANGQWKEFEGMMNQVYGQPKQKIEQTITAPKPLIDLTERKKNGES